MGKNRYVPILFNSNYNDGSSLFYETDIKSF